MIVLYQCTIKKKLIIIELNWSKGKHVGQSKSLNIDDKIDCMRPYNGNQT